MPSSNKSVRIIERKHRKILATGEVVPLAKTDRQIEHEMAETVASWIDERREGVKEFARTCFTQGATDKRKVPETGNGAARGTQRRREQKDGK
jgi:hypothetical protein